MAQHSTEHEIQSNLNTIFTKLQNPSTTQIGYELFKRLIYKHISTSENAIVFILNNIASKLTSLPLNAKEPFLKLISHVFQNSFTSPSQKATYYPYISPSLSLLQSHIIDTNTSLYVPISNIFADITLYTMITDIESSQDALNVDERKHYEILQGFCIYNMKEQHKSNQICGSLCLTKLVENCPIVLQSNYLKFIWEHIMSFIDKKEYTAKYELLNCLISLILGAEVQFKPHAVVTLFKVMEFLTDNDWLKRKLALNVIYTIAFYCKNEIESMKTHLVSFLKLLKTDKVKDVREIAISILKLLNEVERDESEENKKRKRSKSPNVVKSGVGVNRKDDNSFVNEKMVIKTNPERSIFKSGKNKAFFNKENNRGDVVLVDKKVKQHEEEIAEGNRNDIEEDKDMNINVNVNVDNQIENNVNINNNSYQEKPSMHDKQLYKEQPIVNETLNEVKPINNNSNNNYNNNRSNVDNNSKMINALLSQMNMLSSKQILLLDTITQIQNDTQSQINTLNTKITSLESTLSSLSKQLISIKSQPPQSDINTYFKQALSQDTTNPNELLSLLSKTSLNQLKTVNIDLIEESIDRLLPLLSKGEHVKQIISFYKTVLLALRLPLKNETIQNVKDVLEYVSSSGVDGGYVGNINEEEMIDISIILSSLIENK